MALGKSSLDTYLEIPLPPFLNKISLFRGFTLIELLVSLIIFATLSVIALVLFNPIGQIIKGQNAHRQRDLDQVRDALDTYYNDHGCYPLSVPFGSKWSVGTTVYMQKVPQDIQCNQDQGICYLYETDGSACPQWNILFDTLQTPFSSTIATCPLTTADNCQPTNLLSQGVNYCLISGDVGCDYVSANPLPVGPYTPPGPTSTPTPTPIGGIPTPTPKPTGTPTPTCTPHNWSCTGGGGGIPDRCNRVPDGTGTYCNSTCSGVCL